MRTLAILASLTALAVCGCGGAADGGESTRIPVSAVDYGSRSADVGDPAALNRLANLYATLQRRFQAGDVEGVCARVSAHLLEQFPPGPQRLDGPCTRQLAVYARRLERRGAPRPRLRIDWLRIYEEIELAGITATDERGGRTRISFLRERGQWKLHLGVFDRPDTLNGTLDP